jgi:hypothetical protein
MHSDEYQAYMKALCRIASQYVSRIRVQFAEKAFEMFQNETVRKIVLAYGEEAEKLDERRLRDFRFAAEYRDTIFEESLNDDCLNAAHHYASTVKLLFDIH